MSIVVQNALPLRVDDEHIPAVIPPVDTNPIPRGIYRRVQDARVHGIPEKKVCRECGLIKPSDEFTRNIKSRDLLNFRCKTCNQADHKNRYSRLTPDEKARIQSKHLERTYGLTLEQRQEMLDAQGGVCAICGEAASKGWHVDHSHKTGKIRGVLCGGCNTALGGMRDSPAILRAAAVYVEKHELC